jgi:DNA-binding NtrC family response regulator
MARILVVEDECDLLDVLRDVLTKVGHEVFCASGARGALASYDAHHPDVVITDIFLPDESGLNLIFELTRTSDVKVIAISGGGSAAGVDFLECAEKFGAWRVLNKPLRRDELLSAVAEACGGGLQHPAATHRSA